jgi:hypothetical protein
MNHVALCVASLCFPLLAVAAPAVKGKAVYYHPTKVGDTRVYVSNDGDETIESTDEVTKVEGKDDARLVSTRWKQGKGGGTETARVSEQGVVLLSTFNVKAHVLRLPAKEGESWSDEQDFAGIKTRHTTGKEEDVEVPAGKFKAIRMATEIRVNGETKITILSWYAPQVGLVKSVMRVGGKEDVRELKSFTPGK